MFPEREASAWVHPEHEAKETRDFGSGSDVIYAVLVLTTSGI